MIKLGNRFKSEKPLVSVQALKKLAFEVGTIGKVSLLKKAKKPSYEMDSSFGNDDKATKKSCGQFARHFTIDELTGKQVLALTNLAPVRIAGIKSEYLTLGFADEQNDGQAICISPCVRVANGQRIAVPESAGREEAKKEKEATETENASTTNATYDQFQAVEIKSGTILDIVESSTSDLFGVIDLGNDTYTMAFIPGKLKATDAASDNKSAYVGYQVPVITNLDMGVDKEHFEFNSLLVTVPTPDAAPSGSGEVALLRIDKSVKNGLDIF